MFLQRFAAVIMRIREPKTTALIFASGKMVGFDQAFGTFLSTTVEVLFYKLFYMPLKCHLGLFLLLSLSLNQKSLFLKINMYGSLICTRVISEK